MVVGDFAGVADRLVTVPRTERLTGVLLHLVKHGREGCFEL
jgi:hypothetical protein